MNKSFHFILAAVTFFNVEAALDDLAREELAAELRFTGEHVEIYVEKNIWQPVFADSVSELVDYFDQTIYPQMKQMFGQEKTPGVDQNERITVLISNMTDVFGYINRTDNLPKAEHPRSNQREMVYLNAKYLGQPIMRDALAHEFQHLINVYQREEQLGIVDDVWLNEAFSEYAPTVAGLNDLLAFRRDSFLRDPSNSLVTWEDHLYDYSPVSLFMHYLVEQQGEEAIEQIYTKASTGIEAISEFRKMFINWTITNYHNNCQTGKSYCYQNEILKQLRLPATARYTLFPIQSISVGSFTEPWAPHWYKISGLSDVTKNLRITFNGRSEEDDTEFFVPLVTVDKNGGAEISFIADSIVLADFGTKLNSVTLIPSATSTAEFSFSAALTDDKPSEYILSIDDILQVQDTLDPQVELLLQQVAELEETITKLQRKLIDLLQARIDRLAKQLGEL